MTPREFDALMRRHRERERLWNFRFGLGPSVTAAVNGKKRDPLSFFGDASDSQQAGAAGVRPAEAILPEMLAWANAAKQQIAARKAAKS